jgi:Tfp pilus assembly protein PilF
MFLSWCGGTLRKIWPYFALIVLYVPARIHALKGFSHTITLLSTAQLVFTWPSLIAFWIRHLVWPAGLSTFYDFPAVVHPTAKNFVLPAIFDLCVGALLIVCARSSRSVAFFTIWLALPLVPLLNLRVFVADDFAHDRYLYLPSVGFAVLAAMLLKKVCTGPPRWIGMPASLSAVSACLTVAMAYGTITESSYFRDNLTFYAYNLTKAPHNRDAESNYATVLAESGMYGPALEKFADVVQRYPDYWTAIYNLGFTYYKIGRLPEAEEYFAQAIRTNPNKPDQYFYLGMAQFKSGHTSEAITAVRQAIAIRPNGYAYHFALGVMLKTQGDLPGALREFKQELENYPAEESAAAQVMEIEKQVTSEK